MSKLYHALWVSMGVAFGVVALHAYRLPVEGGVDASQPSISAVTAKPRLVAQTSSLESIDRALIDRYCVTCHNEKLKTAGLVLDKIDLSQVSANAETLEKIAHKLRTGQMPPMGRPRPEPDARDAFVTNIERALDHVAAGSPNPGRVAAHRLNRLEYVNAIRDLLALNIDSALLPADNGGVGFDNNADVLSITPALMDRYMLAATKVSRLAVGDPSIRPATQVYRASDWATQTDRTSEDMAFGTRGGFAVQHAFPLDGDYEFKVRLQRTFFYGTIRGIDEEHELEVRVDGKRVQTYKFGGKYRGADPGILIAIPEDEVAAQKLHDYHLDADKDFSFRIAVNAGTRLVSADFINEPPAVSEMIPLRSRSLKSAFFDDVSAPGIGSIEIVGPYNPKSPEGTPSRRAIFSCRPATRTAEAPCARQILTHLAHRAYRRPVTFSDVHELMSLYELGRKGATFDVGIGRALEGLLSMPAFLFRIEHDPPAARSGQIYRVSDVELASRLSFFLWKSIPDVELLNIAERQQLREPRILEQQVRRLLADPKSTRWMTDFVSQWLTVRNLQAQEPDPGIFPNFDDNLREAMARETELFFESQVREDHSVLDLLRANYTYLNERLAKHYGIEGVYGNHFRRVTLADPTRQGLLGQASVLTVTSYAHRTSVVLRGKWVLENLLGAPPPPPPPNVPPLKENQRDAKATSLRERMEEHRKNPVCASCHSRMDPIGFALENFDATGGWRNDEDGAPIDTSITLADGTKIASAQELREVLLTGSDQFLRTLTEKVLAYGLGRSVEYYDQPTVRQLVRQCGKNDYQWSSLVLGIVTSKPFQMRRVAQPTSAASASATVAERR